MHPQNTGWLCTTATMHTRRIAAFTGFARRRFWRACLACCGFSRCLPPRPPASPLSTGQRCLQWQALFTTSLCRLPWPSAPCCTLPRVLSAIVWLEHIGAPLLLISSMILLVAAIGQFIGHRLETGGSLSKDILYCVIAPVWVLAAVYRKLGIPY